MTAHLFGGRRRRAASEGDTIPVTTNLHIWLRADLGITLNGSTVSTWADQSGNGNDGTQGTAANQFGYDASGFNGQACVTAPNTTPRWVEFANTIAGATAVEIFIVFNKATDPSDAAPSGEGGLWKLGTDASPDHIPHPDASTYCGAGSNSRRSMGNIAGTWADPSILNISSAAGSYIARLNGTAIHTDAANTVAVNADPKLGAFSTSYFIEGKIAEFALYRNATLSAGDRTLVHAYLGTRYSITVA
jgi:hypothetical protein